MYQFPDETHTQAIATDLVQTQIINAPWKDAQKTLTYLARRCTEGDMPNRQTIADLRTAANEYSVIAATAPASMPLELEAWLKDRFHVATGLYLLSGLLQAASQRPVKDQKRLVKSAIARYVSSLLRQIESDIATNPAKQVDDYLANSSSSYQNISARMFAISYPKIANARGQMMLELAGNLLSSKADLEDLSSKTVHKSPVIDKTNVPTNENQQAKNSDVQDTMPVILAQEKQPISEIMKELDKLIGLAELKSQVKSLTNVLKVQKQRQEQGLPVPAMTHHAVFIGAPGTGKTTIARLLCQIYHSLGLLETGQLVEVTRQDLVAEYVGQTAIKTNRVIDMALGNLLLIDEAYSLAPEGEGRDFGTEAIETLLKRMEDDRDKFVVIVTGYPREMERFLNANSGLSSRFSDTLIFPDYSDKELSEILNLFVKKGGYKLTPAAKEKVKKLLLEMIANKDYKFGNARAARKLFESLITAQANRLAKNKNKLTKSQLMSIQGVDVEEVVKNKEQFDQAVFD